MSLALAELVRIMLGVGGYTLLTVSVGYVVGRASRSKRNYD